MFAFPFPLEENAEAGGLPTRRWRVAERKLSKQPGYRSDLERRGVLYQESAPEQARTGDSDGPGLQFFFFFLSFAVFGRGSSECSRDGLMTDTPFGDIQVEGQAGGGGVDFFFCLYFSVKV